MLDGRSKYRSWLQQKDFGVIKKVCSLKTSNFQLAFSMFIPGHFTCRLLMNFWMKNWGVKRHKKIFFCKPDIKDDYVFYTYISMITKIKIFTYWYIKKVLKDVYAFLIKLLATAKKLIRSNFICCLKNQAIFYRVSIEIGSTPPLPLFVFIRSLRTPPPPSRTNPLSKRACWKRWQELMIMLVHSCI